MWQTFLRWVKWFLLPIRIRVKIIQHDYRLDDMPYLRWRRHYARLLKIYNGYKPFRFFDIEVLSGPNPFREDFVISDGLIYNESQFLERMETRLKTIQNTLENIR